MIEDPEHDSLVEKNVWLTNLDETIALIKKLSAEDSEWTWIRNSKCKYVDIRIDMRDGAFVLRDRDGNRISLKQLAEQ